MTTETRNVRLAVSSHPADTAINEIREHALASGWFVPAAESWDEKLGTSVNAMLRAPAGGLSQALGRRDADVQLLIDASNVTRAQAMERYMKSILEPLAAKDSARSGLRSISGFSTTPRSVRLFTWCQAS